MNPEHQASLLSRWLEGPPGHEPPAELDRDVVEAIYALRPEMAPAPRADYVLAGLLDLDVGAPPAGITALDASVDSEERPTVLMSAEDTELSEALALDETLELDPDPPRVDDGLADLRDLLVPREPVGELPDEETQLTPPGEDTLTAEIISIFPGKLPDPSEEPAPSEPVEGGALLDLFPFARVDDPEPVSAPRTGAPRQARPLSALNASDEDVGDEDTPIVGELEDLDDDPTPIEDMPLLGRQETTDPSIRRVGASAEPKVVDLTGAGRGEIRRRRFQTAASVGLFMAAAAALMVVIVPEMGPVADMAAEPAAVMELAERTADEVTDKVAALAEEVEAELEEAPDDAAGEARQAPSAEPVPAEPAVIAAGAIQREDSGPATAGILGADDAPDADAPMAASAPAAPSEAEGAPVASYRDVDGTFDLIAAAEDARAQTQRAAPGADFATEMAENTISVNYAEELATYKATAWPRDYVDEWYLSSIDDELALNRVNQALQGVETYLRIHDFAEASKVCEGLIYEDDLRIAQDFAFRAAQLAKRAGQYDRALSLIHQGKNRGSSNTPFLANLHALEGEIQEQRREELQALNAYKTAANLNAARR